MDKVIRDSVTLNARSVGVSAPEREVLLIHGLNANMAFWHPVLTREIGARRFVVMYDQRGHGRSDMPPSGYTPTDLAYDAASVLDSYGVHQADVIAHSFGGTVALRLAKLYPHRVRSIVLLDARLRLLQAPLKLGDWPDFERWRTSLGAAGERLHPDLDLDSTLPLHLGADLRIAGRDLVANGFAPLGGGRRGAERYRSLIEDTSAAMDYKSCDGLDLQSLRRLECPVLAIYGSRSPFLETLTALERELPCCEGRIVDEGGHNFPVRFPELTARLVLDFLDADRGLKEPA